MSGEKTGDIVKRNLATGKSYVHFYPVSLKSADEKIRRLQRNIGADNPKLSKNVMYVAIKEWAVSRLLPPRGNIILFFKDDPTYGARLVF
jgi:hypothetical protein